MITEALVVSEFISAALALVLVFLFFKAYRLRRSAHLLGLPIGFSFLASSYAFLGAYLLNENDVAVSESFLWLRLVTQSYGFAFVAFTYYFSSKTEMKAKYSLRVISLASAISLTLLFGALVVAPPFLGLPSVNVVDEYLRIANLFFLGYVIYNVTRRIELSHKAISDLIWAPLAFSLFWLAQYSMLIWGIDGSQIAFVSAHLVRLASLTIFIRIYYLSEGIASESTGTYSTTNLL
jgi:hypothetical protein